MTDWIEAHKGTTGLLTTVLLTAAGALVWFGRLVFGLDARITKTENAITAHDKAIVRLETLPERIEENTICVISEFEKRQESKLDSIHRRVDEILLRVSERG